MARVQQGRFTADLPSPIIVQYWRSFDDLTCP
jgi:hypothetical protein